MAFSTCLHWHVFDGCSRVADEAWCKARDVRHGLSERQKTWLFRHVFSDMSSMGVDMSLIDRAPGNQDMAFSPSMSSIGVDMALCRKKCHFGVFFPTYIDRVVSSKSRFAFIRRCKAKEKTQDISSSACLQWL
jgi:hypothetical protein